MKIKQYINSAELNIDKIILLFLPIVFFISLLIFKGKALIFTSWFILSFFFYESIVYKNRKKYGFSGLRIISVPSLATLTYTIFIAIPGIYIASINKNMVYPFYLSIVLYYFVFPAGLFIGEALWPIEKNKFDKLYKKEIKRENYEQIIFNLLVILFIICLGGLFLYVYRMDRIPLVELIKAPGAFNKAAILREEAHKLLNVPFIEKYFYNWLRNLFIPVGVVGSLFYAMHYKKFGYKIFFVIFLITGLITNSLALTKSPSAGVLLAIAVFIFFYKKQITLKFILLTIILSLLFPILLTILMYAKHPHLFRLIYITFWERIIIVPSQVLYEHFKIFPNKHDFLYGRSTQIFSWMSEKGLFPLSNHVAKVWWQSPTTTGCANAIYMSNYWADFGYYGLILPHFVVGFLFYSFYWVVIKVSNYKLNILYIVSIASTVPIFTFFFFSSNFTILFTTRGLLIVIIVLKILEKYIKLNPNYNL